MNTECIRLSHLYGDLESRVSFLRKDSSAVKNSRKVLEETLRDDRPYYGVNTGFGILANEKISKEDLSLLQHNLILSHAVGLGDPVKKEICRLMLQLKIHGLSLGYSAISNEAFERLLLFEEKDLIPAIPEKGSLGASGDLAPLSHLSLPLIGRGRFWDKDGNKTERAAEVLEKLKLEPIKLQMKDGLALCNGTQFMSAYGSYILHRAQNLLKVADIVGAISLEAFSGSVVPFDSKIHEIRPHEGQIQVAENIRNLVSESSNTQAKNDWSKVQDPYSLRCIPQVHGASRDALKHAASVVEKEINSVTDNPLVFPDGSILSGGNFHGQPLALSLDFTAIALAELANISERRIYLLLEGKSDLPALLMENTGVNSGFMVPQYTAASLVSQNKVLCHPASVDSIPTCLGQEDHVSMGATSATKLYSVFENVVYVLAIEALTAAQALDFKDPKKAGKGIREVHECIRNKVSHRSADDLFRDNINNCIELIKSGELVKVAEKNIGALH